MRPQTGDLLRIMNEVHAHATANVVERVRTMPLLGTRVNVSHTTKKVLKKNAIKSK